MGFADDINRFAKIAVGNSNTVVRRTIIDISQRVIARTPVGDAKYWQSNPPEGYVGGHARANWSLSINAPVVKEYKAIDGSKAEQNISLRRIKKIITNKTGATDGVYYVQNSVPYIEVLEDGHSKNQAPNGMVAVTAAEFEGIVSTNVDKVKK